MYKIRLERENYSSKKKDITSPITTARAITPDQLSSFLHVNYKTKTKRINFYSLFLQ